MRKESSPDAPVECCPGLGERLQKLRKQRGLSQGQLSVQVGVNKFTLSIIERGAGNPKLGTLLKLNEALGTSLSYLLGLDEKAEAEKAVSAETQWYKRSAALAEVEAIRSRKLLEIAHADISEMWEILISIRECQHNQNGLCPRCLALISGIDEKFHHTGGR